MKGISIFTEEGTNRKILQFDAEAISKNPRKFEDFIDVAIAQSRKNKKKISWASAKKELKKLARV
jgi:hypothetical protein